MPFSLAMLNKFIRDPKQVPLFNLPDIMVFSCHFAVEYYDDSFFHQLNISFPRSLGAAVNKRKAEFLAGRYIAEKTLRQLSLSGNINIPIGKHRSPIWPPHILASISHTHNKAYCVAAKKVNYRYLGLDHENWLTDEVIEQIKSSILVSSEHKLLQQTMMTTGEVFTLIFSMKESVFKALYPLVGRYFDFQAAEIQRINFTDNLVEIKLLESLNAQLLQGQVMKGYFFADNLSITTLVID
jgi:4'-phosphopantetheinyl transferase EntD